MPTILPTMVPSIVPTGLPTAIPTTIPTIMPTVTQITSIPETSMSIEDIVDSTFVTTQDADKSDGNKQIILIKQLLVTITLFYLQLIFINC